MPIPSGPSDVPSCVIARFTGDASTYDPNLPGWREGGHGLATGGTYNPNGWEAALQLDIARKYGCGYGAGKTCQAIVEESVSGRAVVLVINDNGPLVPGRVIDLNNKSMQYLSGGKYGNNSGVLKNVTLTLLCNTPGFIGPLNEADRQAFQNATAGTPLSTVAGPGSVPYTGAAPYTAARPTGSPFGAAAPYPVSSSGSAAQGAPPSSYGSSAAIAQTPVSQQISPFSGITAPQQPAVPSQAVVPNGPAVASLLVQKHTVPHDGTLIISWTSLNMDPSQKCTLALNGSQAAQATEGTKIISASTFSAGVVSITLACKSSKGESVQKSDAVVIQS